MNYIILGIIVFFVLFVIALYNNLVSIGNQCDEAWSNVDTELKRRYDLIPNLISAVRGYAAHEKSLLEELVKRRERAFKNQGSIASQAKDEIALEGALHKLMVRLEAYPELKASRNFLELQKELANTEDRIQAALRFYNGNVRENNNKIQQFPSNIVASLFRFGRRDFFKLNDMAAKLPPVVQF
ncbi:MAG: LemA family protein [Oscillatoriales cyanobacterium RU_3_3]|nr:LemA family protein [Oscillatoriales cyanobacterium RU_3_3]